MDKGTALMGWIWIIWAWKLVKPNLLEGINELLVLCTAQNDASTFKASTGIELSGPHQKREKQFYWLKIQQTKKL